MAPQPHTSGFERLALETVRPGAHGPGATPRATKGLAAFLELAGDGLRVAMRRLDPPAPDPRLIIELGRDSCRILLDGAVIGRGLRTSDAAAIARAAAAALPERRRPGDVALGFTDEIALDLALSLPKDIRSVLEEAAAAHAADETPFAPGEGLAFWTIERAKSATAEITISVVPSRAALAILEELAALGIEPRHAVRKGRYVSFIASPEWLAADRSKPTIAARFAQLPRVLRTGIIAVGIVLASCLINIAVISAFISVISDKAATAAETVRRDKRFATDIRYLAARQKETLAKIRVLDEAAARLPDTTYFERIEGKDDTLELTALGISAAETMKLVSAIDGVKSAELQSAVVRDASRSVERFKLALTISGGGGPAAGSKPKP